MHMIARLLVLVAALAATLVLAPARAAETLTIGYLELRDDPRYDSKRLFARYLTQALGRPYEGAEIALKEMRFHGQGAGVEFAVERVAGKSVEDLLASVDEMSGRGVHFYVLDAPAEAAAAVSRATVGKDVVLFNISAPDDRLRAQDCQPHLLHIIPSHAMAMDALVQYLVKRNWREALVLVGPDPNDALLESAFTRAANRYRVEIVDRRTFELGTDPRQRDQNNIAILSGDEDYDVVFVADADGEFARNVPYHTVHPQLVVGTEGLAAVAWHWAWDRHGAPQLEKRFEKKAKRPMRDVDWAAWLAVKSVGAAVQRTESGDFRKLRDYLKNPELVLDGFKGNRMNFRPWNNQLRQPVLLGTHNWIVDRAPIDGFLHQKNNLDTIGFDERESACKM